MRTIIASCSCNPAMKKFQRTIEDFTCEHCGAPVVGTGYTNHCPHCLWSKHVDINPGDRSAGCLGLMEPIRIEGTAARFRIVHRCTRCVLERRNDVAANDEPDALVAIAQKAAAKQ